jgi:histone H2A
MSAEPVVKRTNRKKPESRSHRAGITFPIGRIHRELRGGRYATRFGSGAPVYVAAILEYLTAEVLELSGNCAKDRKHKRIFPRDILLAVQGDEELAWLTKGSIISQGGVLPSIHRSLLPPEVKKKEELKKVHADDIFKGPFIRQ